MHLNNYQALAARTINKELSGDCVLAHALHGLCAEVGELHGIFQKLFQGHEINKEHAMKECGDILWMLCEFITVNGWTLEEIARMNIEKLKKRYPDGFEEEKSRERMEGDI